MGNTSSRRHTKFSFASQLFVLFMVFSMIMLPVPVAAAASAGHAEFDGICEAEGQDYAIAAWKKGAGGNPGLTTEYANNAYQTSASLNGDTVTWNSDSAPSAIHRLNNGKNVQSSITESLGTSGQVNDVGNNNYVLLCGGSSSNDGESESTYEAGNVHFECVEQGDFDFGIAKWEYENSAYVLDGAIKNGFDVDITSGDADSATWSSIPGATGAFVFGGGDGKYVTYDPAQEQGTVTNDDMQAGQSSNAPGISHFSLCGNYGSLTITKDLDTSGINEEGDVSLDNFAFYVDGEEVDLDDEMQMLPGTYKVTESDDLSTTIYNVEAIFNGDCNAEGEITVVGNEDAVCEITNVITYNDGTLKIVKKFSDTTPDGITADDFSFYVDNIEVAEGVEHSYAPGTYNITEESQLPGAYQLDSSDFTLCGEDGEVVIQPGQHTLCTITNYISIKTYDLTVCKEDDEGVALQGWTVFTYEGDEGTIALTQSEFQDLDVDGLQSKATGENGCAEFTVEHGTHFVGEVLQTDWKYVSGGGDIDVTEDDEVTIVNEYVPPAEPLEEGALQITKFTCPVGVESISSEYHIDSEGNFLPHPDCTLTEDVQFGLVEETNKPIGDTSSPWARGPIAMSGTTDELGELLFSGLNTTHRYGVVELDGEGEPVNPENILYFQCQDDATNNVDEYEFTFPEDGVTKQCVTYNAAQVPVTEQPVCEPGVELIMNGGFEAPIVTASQGWDIFAEGTSGLEWNVEWTTPGQEFQSVTQPDIANVELHAGVNGWNPHTGHQYTELDSDWNGHVGTLNNEPSGVRIFQTIATEIGEEYTLEFAFSPRPGTSAANNEMDVEINGVVVDTIIADGTGNGNTVWEIHTVSFTATQTATEIAFVYQGTQNAMGAFLDSVSVTCDFDGGTQEEGTIEVQKVLNAPQGITTDDFSFFVNGESIALNTQEVFAAGEWKVTEESSLDTDLYEMVTTFGGACDAEGTIMLETNQNAVCVVTNTVTEIVDVCELGVFHLDVESSGVSFLSTVDLTDGDTNGFATYQEQFRSAVAIANDGAIYSMMRDGSNTGDLVILNDDGTFDPVGATGLSGNTVAMSFAPDGTLYAMNQNTNGLYTVDTSTGAASLVYTFAPGVDGGDFVVNEYNYLIYVKANGNVYQVDLEGGFATTQLGSLPSGSYTSAALHEGTYYAMDRNNDNLYSFEVDTFSSTFIGNEGIFSFGDATACPPEAKERPELETSSTVLMCKEDQFGNELEGWQLLLIGEKPVAQLEVTPFGDTYTANLPEGNYVVVAEGKYTYRPTAGARYSDAAFSQRLTTDSMYIEVGPTFETWVRLFERTELLSLQVNGVAVDWGTLFHQDHIYAYAVNHPGGDLEFRIQDNQYSDNSGSINVRVYEGYAGWTGEDGCFELVGVEDGEYVVDEINHQGWDNISGLGAVIVDGDATFTVVNENPLPPPTSKDEGSLQVVKYTCPAGTEIVRNSAAAPDENGNHTAPPECELTKGVRFGVVHDPENSGTSGPFIGLDDDAIWTFIGETEADGTVLIGSLSTEGRYGVAELDDNNEPVSHDKVIAFFCYGDPGTFTDNWDMTFIQDGQTSHCVMYNVEEDDDLPPGGTTETNGLVIYKYACPEGVETSRAANGPDAEGNINPPQECEPLADVEFGFIFQEGVTGSSSPYPGFSDGATFTSLGLTNEDGRIVREDLISNGRYNIAEIDSQGLRLGDEDTIGFYCLGDTGTETDNYEFTFVPEEGFTYCVAYNRMPPAEDPVCDDTTLVLVSSTNTMIENGENAVETWTHPAWTADIEGATWIWSTFEVEYPNQEEIVNFTQTFNISAVPLNAVLEIASDNDHKVWLNGEVIGESAVENNFQLGTQRTYDALAALEPGENTLVIQVKNRAGSNNPQSNPAGLLYRLEVDFQDCNYEPVPGSLRVCKAIMSGEEYLADWSALPHAAFSMSLSVGEQDIAWDSSTDDVPAMNGKVLYAHCETIFQVDDVVESISISYEEEQITSGFTWQPPLYNHAYPLGVPAEFGGTDADGSLHISRTHPHRTILVVNELILDSSEICEPGEYMIVSDSQTLVEGENATPAWAGNSRWTADIPGATWIWNDEFVADPLVDETVVFTRNFTVAQNPTSARLQLAADNSYVVRLNGVIIAEDDTEFNYFVENQIDMAISLEQGVNTLEVEVTNWALPGSTELTNPAGLLYKITYTELCDGLGDQEDPICSDVIEENPRFANSVVDYQQGNRTDGSAVRTQRSNPDAALEFTPGTNEQNFFSLGFGGWIIVEFTEPFGNGPGDDLVITEETWGAGGYPLETARVYVSQDGGVWHFVGSADNADQGANHIESRFDLETVNLTWAQYVRIEDTTDSSLHDNSADGFDINGIEALFSYEEVCEWVVPGPGDGPGDGPGTPGVADGTGQLIITKVVEGSSLVDADDFSFIVEEATVSAGETLTLPVGEYIITETSDLDIAWTAEWSKNCLEGEIDIVEGETLECTVTNTITQQNDYLGPVNEGVCVDAGFAYAIAKWEWNDEYYVLSKDGERTGYSTSVTGNDTEADWESNQDVTGVVLKGGAEMKKVYQYPEGSTQDTVNNSGLLNKGGNEADISYVLLCGGLANSNDGTDDEVFFMEEDRRLSDDDLSALRQGSRTTELTSTEADRRRGSPTELDCEVFFWSPQCQVDEPEVRPAPEVVAEPEQPSSPVPAQEDESVEDAPETTQSSALGPTGMASSIFDGVPSGLGAMVALLLLLGLLGLAFTALRKP